MNEESSRTADETPLLSLPAPERVAFQKRLRTPGIDEGFTHLIHIGWAKGASTFLEGWFQSHPQIAFAHEGFAGITSVFDFERQAADPRHLRARVTSSEQLNSPLPFAGEKTIDYDLLWQHDVRSAQVRSCELLHHLFATATILIVTRGIRSFLFSAYSQYARTGGDLSFAGFCSIFERTPQWWDYDHVIRLYEKAFGSENVLVLPYELLRDNPQTFFGQIEGRLGVDRWPASRTRVNSSISQESIAWYPRLSRLLRHLPKRGLVWRVYRRVIIGDKLKSVSALLQRVKPRYIPKQADIPPSTVKALSALCESLRPRSLYQPYLSDYGLTP